MKIFKRGYDKGKPHYLTLQKKYTIIRTITLFAISLSLYIIGYITTKTNQNLLTVVAVLGCLPASKSVVEMIMFLKVKSTNDALVEELKIHSNALMQAFDLVFTTYKENYQLDHIVVVGNTICGFRDDCKLKTNLLEEHLIQVLHMDGLKDVSFKVFTSKEKYIDRLGQLIELSDNLKDDSKKQEEAIMTTIFSVIL